MLIAGLRRTGATKYCLDRSEELGIPFVGELNPTFLQGVIPGESNAKTMAHETNYQPPLTSETLFEPLINKDKYVSLVNVYPSLVLPIADKIMLRRDTRKGFYSLANILLKVIPIDTNANVVANIQQEIFSLNAIVTYLENYEKDVVWYEDYFGDLPSNTPVLDQSGLRPILDGIINHLYAQNGLEHRFLKLQETLK